MIKHVVMWKFKDEAQGATKAENLAKVKAALEALPEKIPFIKHMEVNMNVNPSAACYDAVLISEFDTLEDILAYRDHPEHKKISEFVALVRESRASADFEF